MSVKDTQSTGRAIRTGQGSRSALAFLAAMGLLGLLGCDGGTADVEDVEEVAEASIATDEPVVVTGQVGEMLTGSAMTLMDQDTGDEILVLIRPTATINGITATTGGGRPVGQVARSGDSIDVMGSVQEFDRVRLEEELNLVLNEELFSSWEGRRVLLADQLDLAITASPSVAGDGLVTAVPEAS